MSAVHLESEYKLVHYSNGDVVCYSDHNLNSSDSVAQCTREDTLAHYLSALFSDGVMRHNTLYFGSDSITLK